MDGKEFGYKLLGVVFLVAGVIGALGFLEESNPISFISDVLFNLTRHFMTPTASLLFWAILVLLGVALLTPKEGYLDKVVSLRR